MGPCNGLGAVKGNSPVRVPTPVVWGPARGCPGTGLGQPFYSPFTVHMSRLTREFFEVGCDGMSVPSEGHGLPRTGESAPSYLPSGPPAIHMYPYIHICAI